jgi:hypothetical protein
MLLPESSDNMTAIINDLAKLGGTLWKADNTIFDQIGHWFNGVFGNLMDKLMISRVNDLQLNRPWTELPQCYFYTIN